MGSKSAIGIGNGICFKQVRDKGGGSYIDPLVRDSLVGVWIADQNTNESPTRNIIKNTIKDKGGDLELLNFGYKLNSGYGGYIEDFSLFTLSNRFEYSEISNTKITITAVSNNGHGIYHPVREEESALYWNTFKIKVSGSTDDVYISYTTKGKNIRLYNGINTVVVPNALDWHTFAASTTNVSCNITLEFVPEYEGALVTDGKDDLIASTKTVSEMGITDEVTVVSLVHQVSLNSTYNKAFTNYLEILDGSAYIRNDVVNGDKTGIYGYTSKLNANVAIVINNILGDNSDYSSYSTNIYNSLSNTKFSVVGRISKFIETSSVAWYWTFVSNKVLTTDQINQVISYFNLDKHVKPDIIYDTIRQGITNENHAFFNDELVDFSGNGHNMKIYNSAWNKESGINDEGAWQTDGVSDYGNVENLPILKDYTVAIERRWITSPVDKNQCLAFKGHTNDWGAFACEFSNAGQLRSYTFSPNYNILQSYNEKSLVYQSKYSYSGTPIDAESTIDGSTLRLCLPRDGFPFYANVAIKMFLLFSYSLSEFLLERQLKRYKLGTLYPDMVEFRPVIKSNASYDNIVFYYKNEKVENGTYFTAGSSIDMHIRLSSNPVNEIKAITVNGVPATFIYHDTNNNIYIYNFNLTSKSSQKIDITIDEYIRYEDIVQPYPAIINLKQDGKTITWGDKLKVGSDIVFVESANLLPELYTVSETRYNGVTLYPNTIIKVEKSMVFDNARTYLKANEPSCILSPNRLRIPNSSYKILGYIPDLTSKGNHGRLNNFAYTEESGANEDGSIRFDGTDDHITIPTLAHGGKCMLMKVNWNKDALILYDQRRDNNPNSFAIYIPNFNNEDSIAYSSRNDGKTYIDGVLNTSVKGSQLKDVTHNITITNSNPNNYSTVSPAIGSNAKYNAFYAQMVLYDFMLFPEISSEEEIQELNDIVGIEGGYVERPEYYWDAYGKTNSDADKATIIDQVSKDPANALTANNFAFNEESGYSQIVDTALFKNWVVLNGTTYIEYTLVNDTTINITKCNRASIDAFYCRTNVKKKSYYRITGLKEGQSIQFGFTNNIICTVESDGVYEVDWSLVSENYQQLGTTFVGDCNIIIEQVAQYPNGLVSDGVEDNLKNTNMLVLTDYTWIMKRKRLDDKNEKTLLHKGNGYSKSAFLFEFTEGGQKTRSFGNDTYITFPDLISYQSKNSYNGQTIESGANVDGNVLHVFMGSNSYPRYTKAVFYKGMLYSKTIDALSINMLKNLFEKDELIDINNPIFKKKEL